MRDGKGPTVSGNEDRLSVEEMLAEIVKRITPAIMAIYAKQESTEVRIRFHTGNFKQAVQTEVAL